MFSSSSSSSFSSCGQKKSGHRWQRRRWGSGLGPHCGGRRVGRQISPAAAFYKPQQSCQYVRWRVGLARGVSTANGSGWANGQRDAGAGRDHRSPRRKRKRRTRPLGRSFTITFTPEGDQFQTFPEASPGILHHTVQITWLFIAYSEVIILSIHTTSPIHLF